MQKIISTIDRIEQHLNQKLPESKYQFELFDLVTQTRHFRGHDDLFHWGSVYKLFLVAEVIKLIDEGKLKFEDKINLDRKYKKGTGIMKYLHSITEISIEDAIQLIFFTSDNICADMFFDIASDRTNQLFENANCHRLKIKDNLGSIIESIAPNIDFNEVEYIYSNEFYFHFENVLPKLLVNNYCHVTDINTCFNFIFSKYYSPENQRRFLQLIQIPNIVSKFDYDTSFNKNIVLRGKTGTLGFGIVSNECVAIIDTKSLEIKGYFAFLSKSNKNRYFDIYSVLGQVGIEVVSLYEQLLKGI